VKTDKNKNDINNVRYVSNTNFDVKQ